MTDTNRRFSIITLHPHWGQYIISQGMAFLISCALFLAAGHDSITYKMPFVVLGSIMTCIMLYGCLYIHKLSLYHHVRTTDYPTWCTHQEERLH